MSRHLRMPSIIQTGFSVFTHVFQYTNIIRFCTFSFVTHVFLSFFSVYWPYYIIGINYEITIRVETDVVVGYQSIVLTSHVCTVAGVIFFWDMYINNPGEHLR